MGTGLEKSAVVLVHGVGDAETGSTIRALLQGKSNKDWSGQSTSLVVNGESYAQTELQGGPTLIESNWSEFRPVRKSGAAILLEALALIWGMLHISQYKSSYVRKDAVPDFWPGMLYKRFFISCFFWCIHPPIISLFLVTEHYLAATVWGSLLVLVIWQLNRHDRDFLFGLGWVAVLAVMAVSFLYFDVAGETIVWFSTWTYLVLQMGCLSFGFIAMGWLAFAPSSRARRHTLVRLAFIYLPFFVASCVGAVVWVIALTLVQSTSENSSATFDDWAGWYTATLRYSLKTSEIYNGSLTALCGILLSFSVLVFLYWRKREKKQSAIKARQALDIYLYVMPAILVVSLFGFVILVWLPGRAPLYAGREVWEIYSIWAIRIFAFLPFCFGALGFLLKASGDVIFYLCQPSDSVQTRVKAVAKLDNLITYLTKHGYKTLIVSHSQGTIISLDVAKKNSGAADLWISGSPAEAFYSQYLEIDRVEEVKDRVLKNYYRVDDPIAGALGDERVDCNLGERLGGHTNYWKEFSIDEMAHALKVKHAG